MKLYAVFSLSLLINITHFSVNACTEVFLHRSNISLVGRTMDFPINVGTGLIGYNKGVKQASTYMRSSESPAIPAEWTVTYPYLGREILNTGLIVDGANTEGLSAAFLYLPGTKYPPYDSQKTQKTLSFFDLASFALATSKNVADALDHIAKYQIATTALPLSLPEKIAITDVPLHLSLKDKAGNSAVIEAIDGKLNIYRGSKAGNVLTNWPPLPEQYNNLAHYQSLLTYNPDEQMAKFGSIPGFKMMLAASGLRNNIKSMVGIPGDYSPPSRFVRATYLEKNIPIMKFTGNYYYQLEHVLNSVSVPYSELPNSTATLWYTIKDLENNTITYRNSMFLYHGKLSFLGSVFETMDINEVFSTGIKTINGDSKLIKPILDVKDYTYYTVDEFIAKN